MYSEKIDTIEIALAKYSDDLRNLIKRIIKDCININPEQKAEIINVAYYTESEIVGCDFLGIDGNGYGSALFVSVIDCRNEDRPVFSMVDEDGDEYEERTLDDFETTELLYLARMLNDLLDVAREDGKIVEEYPDYI